MKLDLGFNGNDILEDPTQPLLNIIEKGFSFQTDLEVFDMFLENMTEAVKNSIKEDKNFSEIGMKKKMKVIPLLLFNFLESTQVNINFKQKAKFVEYFGIKENKIPSLDKLKALSDKFQEKTGINLKEVIDEIPILT